MSDLKRIVKLAEILVEKMDEAKRLEQAAKVAKADVLRLEREDLPMLMSEAGLTEIKLDTGAIVKIIEDCTASITAKTKKGAFAWLTKNNFAGMIKTSVSTEFPRGAHDEAVELRDELAKRYDVELKEQVHPATLKAFVKERMRESDPIPMDLFNVFPYSKAQIK